MERPVIRRSGDCALVVQFGTAIDEEANARVQALHRAVRERGVFGVRACIPAFCSLTVQFDPTLISGARLAKKLLHLCGRLQISAAQKKTVIEVPVLYDGADLADVAAYTHLTEDEVVRLHTGRDYRIYMLGFLPGFVYLGGMDERLFCPRLDTPRTRIPAGAVGIGGEQTGIYPLASPGGWRLIGTTPIRPFDPARNTPVLFSAGEYIRFVPVEQAEFDDIQKQAAAGAYICRRTEADA